MRDTETSDEPVDPANLLVLADDLQARRQRQQVDAISPAAAIKFFKTLPIVIDVVFGNVQLKEAKTIQHTSGGEVQLRCNL